MEQMSRNEFFITNILELIHQMKGQNLEKFLKDYIDEIEFMGTEQNSLYAKCVYDLKKQKNLFGEQYYTELEDICEGYLDLVNGKKFNHVKYKTEFRKEKYKQLNMDIPKDIMDEFDYYLKENKDTKKSVILQAINNYINKSKKN